MQTQTSKPTHLPFLSFASDPVSEVGGVHDSIPIRPDVDRSLAQEVWEERIRREQRRKKQQEKPGTKPPSSDHTIDDYA